MEGTCGPLDPAGGGLRPVTLLKLVFCELSILAFLCELCLDLFAPFRPAARP